MAEGGARQGRREKGGLALKFFGLEISRSKVKMMNNVPTYGGGWMNIVREGFAGAFQSGVTLDNQRNILAFSAVYACVTGIASDVSKLFASLVQYEDGICIPVDGKSPYWPVLRKPNSYQTWMKFVEQWIVAKLLFGAAFVLKRRDGRGIVVALYVLDSQRVTPLVASNGDVYYQISRDDLSEVKETITVPASEIIHDMMVSLWHPLVGVSPIFACGLSATMGNSIQKNSTRFFRNMSQPSGMLTAPGTISDETAQRLKREWQDRHGGENMGGLAVAGDGLSYAPMTIPAQDAQLIEQLRWTVEDVARCFHVPLYKIGGAIPVGTKLADLDMMYLKDCLQGLIQAMESSLDDGLGLSTPGYHVELDEEILLRMDKATRFEMNNKAVAGGWMAPNEARAKENMAPVKGGESPMIQQQNFSLAALAKRDALPNPFVIDKPTSNPTPAGPDGGNSAAVEDPKVAAGPHVLPEDQFAICMEAFEEELEHA